MEILNCILLCLCVAGISVQAFRSFSKRTKQIPRTRLPPGPKPLPIIGNLLELGDKPHLSLNKLSELYGPIITLQLGQVTTVVISSSSLAKQILRTHDHVFCNRTIPDAVNSYKHCDYSMVWLPVSDRWRNLRKICNSQLFSTKVLDANQANRRVKVQELIADIGESKKEGVAVNIGAAAFKTTLNLLSRTMFSLDLDNPSSKTAREMKETMWGVMEEIGKPNVADYFHFLRKLDLQGIRRRLTYHFHKTFVLIGGLINQRLESRKVQDYVSTGDMLDTLISRSEEKNEEMDKTEVEHLFLDLIGAGTDTTSATMEWAMAELLHSPEKLVKAQAELDQVIGKGKPIEESDIARLPYLQAIIKETFRMHPTVPLLLPRKAGADIEIGGYIVPKGAQVLINAWAVGRDSSVWDNPNLFMPERFLGSEIDVLGGNYELIPFGGGRRICPGMPLAMRMLPLMLGSVLNCFEWKLEDGVVAETMNLEDKFGLTLQMAHSLRAVAKENQSD